MSNGLDDKEVWMREVVVLAKQLGYNGQQVLMFSMDVNDCYDRGLSPEKCIEAVF